IKLFKFNDTHIAQGFGLDWEQKLWDKTYEKYKLKDLKKEFKQKFGEDEYNILSLKINEYFDKKMN
ncbi:MAG: hypothetical protein KGV44_10980, partial [Flavobacteriaceae bacterium]|nr:hypothetical protein [Flavobacteriaceae bacterium]